MSDSPPERDIIITSLLHEVLVGTERAREQKELSLLIEKARAAECGEKRERKRTRVNGRD